MKIHYIVPAFKPKETGFSIAFYNMVKVFCENPRISKVLIYTSENFTEEISEKVIVVNTKDFSWTSKFIRFLGKKVGKLATNLFLYKDLKKIKLLTSNEIILVESLYYSHIASILVDKWGQKKVFLRIHGSLPEVAFWNKDFFRQRLMDFALKLDNKIVTTYHYIDYLNKYYKLSLSNNKRYFILPNTLPDIENENQSLTDNKESVKVLQLGRMDKYGYFQKGFEDSITALISIENHYNENLCSKLEATFIGNGYESERFKKSLKKILSIKVNYFESLPNAEVKEEIKKADVILIPSRFEGMSMFATECLALGKPFIFTSDGGMRDMIFDNVNGLAVRPFNYQDIAKAIMKFVAKPKLINKFSDSSKSIFQSNFSYTNVQKMLNTFLDSVTD